MILIVDSGATKTDWGFCEKGDPGNATIVRTEGMNASTMRFVDILKIVNNASEQAGKEITGKVEHIYFYGAGIVSKESAMPVHDALMYVFPRAYMLHCSSDLAGAAIALFGHGKGVAAIMGTGSNSCLYENGRIIKNISPGGFILGDEGSGAALGKMLLSDYFKELVPEDFVRLIDAEFDIRYSDAVSKIYKGEAPSRYLASFAKFIIAHKEHEYAASLIDKNLRSFIERSLCRYGCSEIGVIGSVGLACREELTRLGAEYGLNFTTFLQSPVQSLISYHGL
ncbi:MAG: hypothetical protein ACI3ZS_07620 [Candidatus Cryptobacteroides sp.]